VSEVTVWVFVAPPQPAADSPSARIIPEMQIASQTGFFVTISSLLIVNAW
jgi:hypothetical protein